MGDKGKSNSTKQNDDDSGSESDHTIDLISRFLAQKLNLISSTDKGDGPTNKIMEDLSFEGLIQFWKDKGFKNVITMVGAGISTSAGIPDFRSPGSGLYDNLQKYNLPHPSAIFELEYFEMNPKPFFTLAKELYPGTFLPTPSHYFVRLLHEKGLLLRHYSQNIDTLEHIAGIPDDKLVEAHGTFFTNHCIACDKLYSMEWMKKQIFNDVVPTCENCNSIVKPDIVFFGENLPDKFYLYPEEDFKKCDLLIIMGTSLEVQPFASLVDRVNPTCLRLLINNVKVGQKGMISSFFQDNPSLLYDSPRNVRDVAYIGNCDDGVKEIIDRLGWNDDFDRLMEAETERIKNASKSNEQKTNKKVAMKSEDNPSTSKAAAKH